MPTNTIPECPKCHRPGIKNGDEYLCLDHGTFDPAALPHQAGPDDQPRSGPNGRHDAGGDAGVDAGHQLGAGSPAEGNNPTAAEDRAVYLAAQITPPPPKKSQQRPAWEELNTRKILELIDLVGKPHAAFLLGWPGKKLAQLLRFLPVPAAAPPAAGPDQPPAAGSRPAGRPLAPLASALDQAGRPRGLELPAWREDWPPETQVAWLQIWRDLYSGKLQPGGTK